MEDSEQTTEEDNVEEGPSNGDAPDLPQAGVLVYIQNVGDGMHGRVTFDLIGSIDPLSVPTLLELAQGVARVRCGLDVRS